MSRPPEWRVRRFFMKDTSADDETLDFNNAEKGRTAQGILSTPSKRPEKINGPIT